MDSKIEKSNIYNLETPEKDNQIQLFNKIAPNYDKRSKIFSLGLYKYWQFEALKELKKYPHENILDIGTGTGTFAILMQENLKPKKITAIDISEVMLKLAHKKITAKGIQNDIELAKEDCANMTFGSNSFDIVTCSYVVRNLKEMEKSFREIYRVLKPGGLFLFMELTYPEKVPMKQLHVFYLNYILPVLSQIHKTTNHQAGEYLPASIYTFPQGRKMMQILKTNGFTNIRLRRLTLGVVTLYMCEKPI